MLQALCAFIIYLLAGDRERATFLWKVPYVISKFANLWESLHKNWNISKPTFQKFLSASCFKKTPSYLSVIRTKKSKNNFPRSFLVKFWHGSDRFFKFNTERIPFHLLFRKKILFQPRLHSQYAMELHVPRQFGKSFYVSHRGALPLPRIPKQLWHHGITTKTHAFVKAFDIPPPVKARALSGNRWKSAYFCWYVQN